VPPKEIDWSRRAGHRRRKPRPPPADVRVSFVAPPRTREHAIELLEKGEIDAALEPYASPNMRYLMDDYRSAEREFFKRTGAYTTNHLFAIREEIVKGKPEVVGTFSPLLKKPTL
jgi:hypothetical protein